MSTLKQILPTIKQRYGDRYNGVLIQQMMIMEAFFFQMQISNQLHLKGKDIPNGFVPSNTFFITIVLVKSAEF